MSDELRHNLHVRRDLPARSRPPEHLPSEVRRRKRTGELLREAREDKGLELNDVAGITNVRLAYLEALEAGRHDDLPEEVYSKNFVRLYAQAVGLDPARMLFIYTQERRGTSLVPPVELEPLEDDYPPSRLPLDRLTRFLATLLLVAGTVGGALWVFNTLLFPPLTVETPPQEAPATTALTPTPTVTDTPPAPKAAPTQPANPTVLLSLRTTPPGAEVSLDGYPFENPSPLVKAPVRAGEARTVRVRLPGYRVFERSFDLTRDRRLNIELTPVRRAPARPAVPAPTTQQLTLTVQEPAWLEVYAGTVRGGGEPLLYEIVEPGERFSFPLPVYVRTGNAGGVRAAVAGGPAELLGAPGEVVGHTFTGP